MVVTPRPLPPRLLILLLLSLLLAALGGCGAPGVGTDELGQRMGPPRGVTVKKGSAGTKPYTIRGKTYHPLLSSHDFREQGLASWYGSDFHGKKTANGERYDMHGMTAAHKVLPFGTRVKVTNRNNGKSIVVRINDRGPFVANRVIDLTKTGAERLGMLAAGTAPVVLQTQGKVAGLQDGDLKGDFYVQVGAFASESNARGLAARIRQAGQYGARVIFAEDVGFWRVQAGPFASLHAAERASDAMETEFPSNFVVAR